MRKPSVFHLYGLLAVIVTLISACASGSPMPIPVTESGQTEIDTPSPTPILSPTPHQRVPIRWLSDNAAGWRPDETWLSEFHASQDDIEIILMFEHGQLEVVSNLLYIRSKGIQTVLPDIAPYATVNEYARLNLYDYWLDLTPYLQDYDLSVFDPTALRLWQDENGEQFGLPVKADISVIYYNRDLFDAAGIPYPPSRYGEPYADGEEWNIDKLEQIAMQLTLDGNGKNPTQPGFNAQDIAQWGFAPGWIEVRDIAGLFGPEPIFDENGDIRLPESWRESMHWYYSGMWEKHFIQPRQDLYSLSALNSGRVAMVLSFSWYGPYCYEWADHPVNWDMAALPSYQGRVSGAATSTGLGILDTTAYPQEAVQALYYLVSLPALLEATSTSSIPAQISRRPAFFSSLDTRLVQDVNWQVALDGFVHQEIGASAGANIFDIDIRYQLSKFQELIETTPGLDIDALLNNLTTDLQNIINSSRP
jgi:multiple sugar transport system substrate-binding protein